MNDEWDVHKKPPASGCPKHFCFHWDAGSDALSDDILGDSRKDDGSESLPACIQPFGVCRRSPDEKGLEDLYEPCEPELKKAGLPWFYFIANVGCITDEFRNEYFKESRELWGEHDGLEA